jgi:large repetitive protein
VYDSVCFFTTARPIIDSIGGNMEAFRAARLPAVCMVAFVAAVSLRAQTPVISGITASFNNVPRGPAITAGTNIPGFTLIINGTFDTTTAISVQWSNPSAPATAQTMNFTVGNGLSVSAAQLQAAVPAALFSGFAVNSPEAVTITVTQTNPPSSFPGSSSTSGGFTLNPPLAPPATPAILPAGTVGVSYSAPLALGGSSPFNIQPSQANPGATPPGLPLAGNNAPTLNLSGTPTAAGTYTWGLVVTDVWGNGLFIEEGAEIVNTPGISSLAPMVVPAGGPDTTITIMGSNFVAPGSLLGGPVAGSVVQLIPIGLPSAYATPLTTQFVSAGQLTATVPTAFLISVGSMNILVAQPGGVTSGTLPLTVAAPALATPAPITARPTAQTVVLAGTNFTQNAQSISPPYQSTVILGEGLLPTTFLSGASLSVTAVFNTPGQFNLQVENPGASAFSNLATLTVLPAPVLNSVSPLSATANQPPVNLTATGTNFTNTMQIVFGGRALPTNFLSATALTATVPTAYLTPGNASVTVVTADNYSTAPLIVTVYPAVQILTNSLPAGTTQTPYDARLSASGGLTPYVWSASGLGGLSINRATGEISGTITATGNFTISVTVTDANGASVTSNLAVTVAPPPPPKLQITTTQLANGQVGVAYIGPIAAIGGTGNYTFSLTVGSLPTGLSMTGGGVIRGTPTTAGTSNFTVQVVDDGGNTATSGFSLVIIPAPLTVTGPSPIPNVTLGAAFGLKFGATGGYPPYTFNYSGNLPPGATLGKDASLNGTATALGTFSFTIYAYDSQQGQATKAFTVMVVPAPLTVTATLGNGQVGVAYSGSIGAAGGQPPYKISVSGLPDGVSFSNGSVVGTPTTAGSYTVTVAATDSAGAQASGSFPVTIAPAALTVTGSLGNGTVGVAYSGSVSASGGVPPYNFSFSGLPGGVTGNSSGSVSGTPTAPGTFNVTATVNDYKGGTASKMFTVVIGTAPLTITSASVGNGTIGTAISATFSATGGVPPYTWSATGLPGGVTLSGSGSLSGTPTAPGTSSVTVTVKDSAGNSATATVTITVALPPSPTVNLTGLPPTSSPGTQSTLQIGIGAAYPVDVTVTLTLTFAADSGPDDPTVQFSTGGRTVTLVIPAGSLVALNGVGVQTGTVAGTATITAQLTASGTDITPKPAPTETVRINAAAPTISSVTATASGSGFTVTVIGYSTTRSITSAVFTFTPASGANLQTTSVTIPVDQIFSAWYGGSAAGAFGSQFTYTQPFNVSGAVSAIASVSVTLVNSVGSSTAVSAALH